MKSNTTIGIGNDLCIGDNIYKIIYIDNEKTYMIKLNTDKIEFLIYGNEIINSLVKAIDQLPVKQHKTYEIEKLSEDANKRYQTAIKIVKDIESMFGPTYVKLLDKNKNGIIQRLSIKYNVSVKTIWKYIRRYLQSAFDYNSLIDARLYNNGYSNGPVRSGRKNIDNVTSEIVFDEKVQQQADTIIKRFKSHPQMTIRGAYQEFINVFYSEINTYNNRLEWLPANKRPSYRQFDYYLRKKLSKQDLDEIRSTKLETLNNKRVLVSSSRTNALRPGWVVECDALEVDLSLVSDLNSEQTIGRPIMYVMVDVLTSCILAVSVSFENNSIIGLTNLFLNLCEDKVDLCRRYGLIIDPNTWPSNVIPHEIRCDRGSDFVSNKFKEICKNLNINLNYEAPGVGSFKGIVEQTFHQFHSTMRPKLEDYGLITKRFNSKHHDHAMLTISSFIKLVLNYVVYHNMHVIKDYPLSKEMLRDPNFDAVPYKLWQHYVSLKGTTFQINESNRRNYLFNLLLPATAKISRAGVKYKGLFYISDDDELYEEMYNCENKVKQFPIKFDPRNTGKLYYSDNGHIKELELNKSIPNNADFGNMTWNEYEEYLTKKKQLARKQKDDHLEINNQLRLNFDYIIEESKTEILPTKKNLLERRRDEKHQFNKMHQINFDDDKIDYEKPNQLETAADLQLPSFDDESNEDVDDAVAALLSMMKGY